ncbi:hypothetical protein F4818DRAFT_457555 [Hypoxylon cercidicola]|nr:hypothetical protein F4818DRAFT_457555 [Hypoxylon cercidicola]
MGFFVSTLPFVACALAAAIAEPGQVAGHGAAQGEPISPDAQFKINYYTDGGCGDFLISIFPFQDGSCYNYAYTGDNSANIANCDGSECRCTFYTETNCGGSSETVEYLPAAPGNCASNWGHGFGSMKFYLNLPICAFAFAFISYLLHIPDQKTTHQSTRQKMAQLDGVGLNNGRIIALLVVAIVFLMYFVAAQIAWPKTAPVPLRIFVQRRIKTASFAMFATGAAMMTAFYYLPIWFQGVQGTTAGLRLLPTVIGQAVGYLAGGVGSTTSDTTCRSC